MIPSVFLDRSIKELFDTHLLTPLTEVPTTTVAARCPREKLTRIEREAKLRTSSIRPDAVNTGMAKAIVQGPIRRPKKIPVPMTKNRSGILSVRSVRRLTLSKSNKRSPDANKTINMMRSEGTASRSINPLKVKTSPIKMKILKNIPKENFQITCSGLADFF